MEFPTDWVVFDIIEYDTAPPAISGECSAELLPHLRHIGRILDGFRFAMDGSKALEANMDLYKILPVDELRGLRFYQQFWPRNIKIWKNMTTLAWVSITDSITSNDTDVLDKGGAGVSPASFMRTLERLPSDGLVNAWTTGPLSRGKHPTTNHLLTGPSN